VAKHDHAPQKKRISAWTNPGLLGLGIVLLLIGLPMVLWLMSYHSDAAVTMFVVTWLSLTVFVLLMAKNSVSDPGYYIDRKILDKTKREIEHHRQFVRKEILKNEIGALQRGEKVPVLDVWRLDETLAKRHPYFKLTDSQLIDARQGEFHIHIQLGEIGTSDAEKKTFCAAMWSNLMTYLVVLKEYSDLVVIQIDSLREDERHVDVPVPILSLVADASVFWGLRAIPGLDKKHLEEIVEIRYDEGNQVEPHRVFELPSSRGLK
jgi:hypothetical protein